MVLKLASSIGLTVCQAVVNDIGVGSTLTIYSGQAPETLSDPTDDAVSLVSFSLPAFSEPESGEGRVTAPLDEVEAVNAIASGIATFFRIEGRVQGSVGMVGEGGDLDLSTTEIVEGQPVEIVTFGISIAAS